MFNKKVKIKLVTSIIVFCVFLIGCAYNAGAIDTSLTLSDWLGKTSWAFVKAIGMSIPSCIAVITFINRIYDCNNKEGTNSNSADNNEA